MRMPCEKVAQLARARQVELADQLVREGVGPGGIKGPQVIHEVLDRHPFGQFLILGEIADLRELPRPKAQRVAAQHFSPSYAGALQIHEHLDCGCFASAVRPHQAKDTARWHLEI
jgi:hypothetical protein